MKGRFWIIGLTIMAVAVGALVSYPADALGGVGGRPAYPDPDNPRSQSIFIYNLNPGEKKSDSIFLSNGSDEDMTVELFPVDGVLTNMGSYTCKQNAEDREGVGAWLSLDKKEVTVPACGDVTVDFSLSVPQRTDVGEHSGCIAIQRKSEGQYGEGAIQVKTRQAVRVAVVVPGQISRKVSIDYFKREMGEKMHQFDISLENSGNVSADVDISIVTKDMFGNEVYRNGGQFPTMRESKLRLMFDDTNKPFWGGFFTSKATISYDKRAGTFGTQDKEQLITSDSQPVSFFVWPSIWAIILIVSLFMLLVSGVVWMKRQKKLAKSSASKSLKNPGSVWARYTVKQGDTIDSLAKKHKTSASKIATINKISTSTSLKTGQSLYLPRK